MYLMDDVDFVPTSQYEKGKDVMKEGLTSVFKLSLIEHIFLVILDCE